MATDTIVGNRTFPIYNPDGSSFHGLELKKSVYESVVMSLGDKVTGDVYYPTNALTVTMKEYIVHNGVKFVLVNPPVVVREGLVSDNGELKGMTKYSFTFYHPMYMLGNFPLCDVAVSSDQQRYLSENKTFFWIGNLTDFVAKLNKNLENTEWYCVINDSVSQADRQRLSEVMSFDKNTIADALKTGYETWDIPYIITTITDTSALYTQGKRFLVQFGLPTTEILVENEQHESVPFVFHFGQGVGLKNNSRNPRNNKIVTRIAGFGSEDNIQYGYPQIPYTGGTCQYPLYYGIVGGQRVQLIKHPFTRTHLMPSIYRETVNKKVNPMASGYDPDIELKDYYDADNTYENPIKPLEPSYEIHEFEDIKPELGHRTITGVHAYETKDLSATPLSSFLAILRGYYTESEYLKEKEELEKIINTIATLSSNNGSVNTRAYYCDWSFTKDERYAYVKYESSALNFNYTVLMVSPSQEIAWDDTMDDDGNYVQSYFRITIPQLSFDLYASAAITQEMTINMRSGACLGCSFPVMVDWDDYKLNFYDSDGNFAPNGSQRDFTKYPDSSQGQISLILQKETSTFGTLMPNIYQKPSTGDEFVVLGISLPTTYITEAEERLDAEMKQYMRDNNVYYFDYPLKFDEYFLTTHAGILSQMDNNVVVRFDYAGSEYHLYIKQISIKYDNKPLPTYDITLTDNIEVVLNQIGQVVDEVRRLHDTMGGISIEGNDNYIRKDIDDTAYGTVSFIKGLQVGNRFVTGLLGEGGVFRKDEDGTTYLECDKLYVRMRAYFDTVEVRHYLHSAGNRIASMAGINCSRVEYIKANGDVTQDASEAVLFRCYFRANDDGREVRNDFVVGDLAFCKETNANTDSIEQHGYWRAVVGRNVNGTLTDDGEGWIDLSASDCQQGSGIPIAQDDIIQLGNKTDVTRQGAIVEFVSGEDAPSYQIFQGINDYNLNNKNYIGLGYSSSTGRAYMNVFGDAFIGEAPDSQGNSRTYIHYYQKEETDPETGQTVVTPTMDIKANVIFQSPDTGEDTSLVDYVNEILSEFQDQIDGVVDTYYMEGTPTMNNKPVTDWIAGVTDEEEKKAIYRQHIGDIYYQMDTGQGFRFLRDEQGNYSWVEISDDALLEALRMAREAADLADSKMRVFVTQPVPPYGLGDLWVNAKYPATVQEGEERLYDDVILRCKTAKDENGTFDINDWTPAQNYSELYNFIEGQYADDMQKIAGQLDKKAETWYQDTDPSTEWQTQQEDTRSEHVGDIWYDTSANGGNKTYVYQYDSSRNRYYWQETSVPDEVFDRIDGKAEIYVTKPTTYNERDLWIIEQSSATCPDSDIPANCQRGDIVVSSASRVNNYQKSDWTKKDRYTDDSSLDEFKLNQYVAKLLNGTIDSDIANAQDAAQNYADAKVALLDYLTQALGQSTDVYGGLVLTSMIALRDKNNNVWSGINGAYSTSAYGGGIAAWFGGTPTDRRNSNGTWNTTGAKIGFRFDGSGYVAGGAIAWDSTGLTNVSVSSVSATSISIAGEGVATQTWVGQNYVSIAFFERLFKAYNGTTQVHPNSTSTIDNIKAMFGFWTEQYISALGKGSGGSSGISIEAVWTALANTDSSKQINISHLTNALSGYNPTNNFKTINGNSIIGTGDITIEGGSGGVDLTAVWQALAANTTEQINATHLTTALSNYLPLAGGTMTNTNRVVNLNADLLDGHHATDFVFGTNGIADSASTLANKTVTASTLDSQTGSFTFEGYNLTVDVTPSIDEVGIQIGSSRDKFQLVCRDYALMIRQNDEGGTDSLNWTKWITLPTKLHTSHQLTKRDQWFRFANLTRYGASYLVSIRDNYYNDAPTPVTWIINVGYDSATITQIGRAVLSPTSLTKLRIIRYELDGDYGFRLEVYTPYQRYISQNTPEINIMNLGRDNMADGIELVHDPYDDTKWLEVDETIESGELLLEEVGISDGTTLWGQPFDGSSSVSGSMSAVTSIEMNSDGALSSFGGFIDFHYGGSSADYTSRIIENASGRIAINDILYVKTNGTVGIGTDSPSTSYKLDVNGDGRVYNLIIGSDSDNVKGKIAPVTFSGTGQGFKLVPDLTNTDVWFAYRRSVTSTSQPMLYLYASIENSGINALQINKADSTTYNFHVGQGFASKAGATTLWGYRIDFKSRLNGTGSSLTYMTIKNDGNVGIGTDSPSYKFQVDGQSYFTGHVGIGTSPHDKYVLRANGEVYVSTGLTSHGYVTALSDIRHKDIRDNVNLTVTDVANAPSVKFLWKDRRKEGVQVGSIAQYWQKVLPEAIVEAADGELTMSYGVIALLASIATARKVEDLERRVVKLEKESKELRERLKEA